MAALRPIWIGQYDFNKISRAIYLAENKHKRKFTSAQGFGVQDYGQLRALARLERQWFVRILRL